MQNNMLSKYERFFGKWILKINGETISIEFLKGGTFNCYSKNSLLSKMILFNEEIYQKFAFHDTIKISPTWDIKNNKLKIILSNKTQLFHYNFSQNDTVLTLTKPDSGKSLSFNKDTSNSSISSSIASYIKFQIMFLAFFIIFLVSLLYFMLTIEFDSIFLIFISWGLVFFVLIITLIAWFKIIFPKLKS